MKTKVLSLSSIAASVAFALLAPGVQADETAATVADAISGGDAKVNLRYRYEFVDEDGKDKDANASTLRTRLTFNTLTYQGFAIEAEVDNVSIIGGENYNSTDNGLTQYPVVADPEGTDINLINLKYKNQGFNFTAGRQRINQDGQRFVGGVGWRQNEQTYDGYRAQYAMNDQLSFDYTYVYNVNRIFGPDGDKSDLKGDTHLTHAKYKINANHSISAFFYSMDFDDAAALSNQTVGFDYNGKFGDFKLHAGYASQSEDGDNPTDYSADYYVLEGTYQFTGFNLGGGIEVLGSDNGVGFATPLATLHKFQGFADKFLSTPADGIEDIYIKAGTVLGGVKMTAIYHDFSSDEGSRDLGTELDLVASYKFNKNVTGLLKYADYSADDHSTDTSKVWAMVNMNF